MAPPILEESWKAYVARFIQDDGRVIDHKAGGITTSEGQAYAMLRAVWIGDAATFEKTYRWAVNNLNAHVRKDHLWAWKWGHGTDGKWHALDPAFATDADQDAALSLLAAARRWNRPRYQQEARAILEDLWNLATIRAGNRRYLLAGDSLCQNSTCRVNPSYLAPYAYRIFSEYDGHRWSDLLDSSYDTLAAVSRLTGTHLPPDWVLLNKTTGALRLAAGKDDAFSYDAFRVFWRVALDRELSGERRAEKYLHDALPWLVKEWETKGRLPAVIGPAGEAKADWESIEMLAALAPALRTVSRDSAERMQAKVRAGYSDGTWKEADSYYMQNWAWFGAALYTRYLGPLELLRRLAPRAAVAQ